jgi:mercuric ion binding protein
VKGKALMPKIIRYMALAFGLAGSSVAFAGEKTVTLAVKNMYCADCPFIVKKSLEGVPGVAKAVVSFKDRTAIVTFDDAKTDINALTNATTMAGYPSAPKS